MWVERRLGEGGRKTTGYRGPKLLYGFHIVFLVVAPLIIAPAPPFKGSTDDLMISCGKADRQVEKANATLFLIDSGIPTWCISKSLHRQSHTAFR